MESLDRIDRMIRMGWDSPRRRGGEEWEAMTVFLSRKDCIALLRETGEVQGFKRSGSSAFAYYGVTRRVQGKMGSTTQNTEIYGILQ